MAETVTMPKLGFDMAEGTLVRWVKVEGEEIRKGDILAEIETDKATVEVESAFSGIVTKLFVEQGTVVPVGAPIAIIAAPGEKVESPQPVQSVNASAPPQIVKVEKKSKKQVSGSTPMPEVSGILKVSPLARRMASEKGIDLSTLIGTGPEGRIVRKDVEAALLVNPPASSGSLVTAPTTPVHKPAPAFINPQVSQPLSWKPGPVPADEFVPLDKLRLAIGRRMLESKQQVPHFTVTHECDVESLLRIRGEVNGLFPEERKLSVNDFIIKAAALALRKFPNLNASLQEEKLLRHGHVHIGVAVAVPGGLLTVVCRDADQKSLPIISTEVKEMAARARTGKVHPEDIEGSTFSISNLGMFAVESFTAIINPPEAAILAVSSARQVPVVQDGVVRPGTRLNVTLSADHRISDGAEAAQFLQALAAYLENPAGLLVEL